VLGDGAYDHHELFNALKRRKVLAGIKARADAATHLTGSPYRAEYVRDRIQLRDIGYSRGEPTTGCGGRAKEVSPTRNESSGKECGQPRGGDVPRDPDESELLQYADYYGSLTRGATDTGRGITAGMMKQQQESRNT